MDAAAAASHSERAVRPPCTLGLDALQSAERQGVATPPNGLSRPAVRVGDLHGAWAENARLRALRLTSMTGAAGTLRCAGSRGCCAASPAIFVLRPLDDDAEPERSRGSGARLLAQACCGNTGLKRLEPGTLQLPGDGPSVAE